MSPRKSQRANDEFGEPKQADAIHDASDDEDTSAATEAAGGKRSFGSKADGLQVKATVGQFKVGWSEQIQARLGRARAHPPGTRGVHPSPLPKPRPIWGDPADGHRAPQPTMQSAWRSDKSKSKVTPEYSRVTDRFPNGNFRAQWDDGFEWEVPDTSEIELEADAHNRVKSDCTLFPGRKKKPDKSLPQVVNVIEVNHKFKGQWVVIRADGGQFSQLLYPDGFRDEANAVFTQAGKDYFSGLKDKAIIGAEKADWLKQRRPKPEGKAKAKSKANSDVAVMKKPAEVPVMKKPAKRKGDKPAEVDDQKPQPKKKKTAEKPETPVDEETAPPEEAPALSPVVEEAAPPEPSPSDAAPGRARPDYFANAVEDEPF